MNSFKKGHGVESSRSTMNNVTHRRQFGRETGSRGLGASWKNRVSISFVETFPANEVRTVQFADVKK